jgi:glycosyltransferase involved in cell wall biosynthesis
VGGGAERVFVQLANEFVALGVHVDFALASAYGPYLDEIAPGVQVIDFGAPGITRAMPKLARYLRLERPDAMLSGLDHANLVAILARFVSGNRTRCVISERAVSTEVYREDRSVLGRITPRLMRVAYRFADNIIANSQFVASDLSQFVRIPKSKLSVIYNPLDIGSIDELSREHVAHPWCEADTPPIVLSVGRLDRFKDFQTLIRAFSIVRSERDCRLVILGEGADRAKLEHLIGQLGLQRDIHLPGFVGNPFAWMRHAAVFVSSSLTEGCPNALMQALACGTHVVSTDCAGGSAEILEGGKWGRLVPIGAPEAMAAAILNTLDSSSHPDVRKRADSFALRRIAQEYLHILLPDCFLFELDY